MTSSVLNIGSKILYCGADVVKNGWATLRSIPISKAIKLAFVGLALLTNPIHQPEGKPICNERPPREFVVARIGPASHLKSSNELTNLMDEFLLNGVMVKGSSIPGIIKSHTPCPTKKNVICYHFVSDRIGAPVSLSPTSLIKHGYKIVQNPGVNDVILYFQTEPLIYRHIGIVSAVKDGEVWVQSKWGHFPCFEHLEEAVLDIYGSAVMYFRK